MEYLDSSPVTSSQIRRLMERDTVLAKVHQWIVSGLANEVPEDEALRPFLIRKSELSVESGC